MDRAGDAGMMDVVMIRYLLNVVADCDDVGLVGVTALTSLNQCRNYVVVSDVSIRTRRLCQI